MITRRAYLRRSPLKRKPRRAKTRLQRLGIKTKWYLRMDPEEVRIHCYWSWLRDQACCVCASQGAQQQTQTQIAHVGLRGLGQKCNGWEVLPLCRIHHERGLPESHHTLGKRFWLVFRLDRYGLISAYKKRYFSLIGQSASRAA